MTEYKLLVEKKYDRTFGFYDACGITVVQDGVETHIPDISTDREKIENLVKVFNEESLDPAHLPQAVEEFLYDFKV